MKRTELLAKLEAVQPALSNNNLIPIMTHYWFTGDRLMAYNDSIAISVPFKTDFACAVPGLTLLNLVKASGASDAELVYEKDEVTLKMASTRAHLVTMEKALFNFEMPDLADATFSKVDNARFFKAIDACLRSVSIDTSVPDQLGVTIIGAGKELLFFATNNDSLSHAFMPLPSETKFKRAILGAPFCREMLSIADKKKGVTLEVHPAESYSLFEGTDGTVLWGKLVEAEKPLDMEKTFDEMFPRDSEKKLVAIPTKMEMILDRACIVAASNVTPVLMEIVVSNGEAKFVTASQKTELFDSVTLEKGQPNVKLRVDPKLVKNGYGSFTKMLMTERAFIMATNSIFYFVANSEVK